VTKKYQTLLNHEVVQDRSIEIFVMPAWIAGIQICKDASGNIHVNLIPALHAGTTQSRSSDLN
jgi:hypothetical protein